MLLIFAPVRDNGMYMTIRAILIAFAALILFGVPGQAACYADYKASRDNPLKLHYGVIEINANPCVMSGQVQTTVAQRLGAAGWKLLQVQSVFEDGGLSGRKQDAGQYFLRF